MDDQGFPFWRDDIDSLEWIRRNRKLEDRGKAWRLVRGYNGWSYPVGSIFRQEGDYDYHWVYSVYSPEGDLLSTKFGGEYIELCDDGSFFEEWHDDIIDEIMGL